MIKAFEKNQYIFLDGAMGTMLQAKGLRLGEQPELLCLTEPEIIRDIHQSYIDSGSNILYANTFGANRHKLQGTGHSVEEVITAAVTIAKQATEGTEVLVGLDVGPIGELLEPSGTLTFQEAYDIFKEMIIAGAAAGADLIAMETMTDLYEVKAGVLAVKENTDLPVFVTMTFESNGRTFTGCSLEAMACVLEGLGVDAVGINCSLGPVEILPFAKKLAESTNLPLIIKANAGLPDPQSGAYDISPDQFAEEMLRYIELGIKYVGGCCGTTPEYIRQIVNLFQSQGKEIVERDPITSKKRQTRLCTPTNVVTVNGVQVIGERINPTGKKRFKQALKEKDMEYILLQGIQQAEAGANILDVNVGTPGIDETKMMVQVVKSLQSVLDLPLQIDSSDPEAIEAGLRVCNGKAIVNSVNGDEEVLKRILPIVKKYGAAVVGLTLDSSGIPNKAEDRFIIAERIVNTALGYGIPREDIFIDCLTLTVSAQQAEAVETLKAVKMVKERLDVLTVLGVSNISFGLPNRELINHTFLTLALAHGLDMPILNPNNEEMMNAIRAFRVLYNQDKDSEEYIKYFADYTPPATKRPSSAPELQQNSLSESSLSIKDGEGNHPVLYAIEKGLKEDARRYTIDLMNTVDEMEIINKYLIPALDLVGEKFERGKIFLPQLLNSAGAASEAFDAIKDSIVKKGAESVSKGKIIIATVKGDIHDIGKNIVKVILENYGYDVIDLGRDVSPDKIVETAIAEKAKLVGLSALMTTTLKSMAETIAALRQSGYDCKIVVGGAVLTPEYAQEIGADYYAKDAKEAVDVAKKVFS